MDSRHKFTPSQDYRNCYAKHRKVFREERRKISLNNCHPGLRSRILRFNHTIRDSSHFFKEWEKNARSWINFGSTGFFKIRCYDTEIFQDD